MLDYAQKYKDGHQFVADICIVGSGAAGITLAHKLLGMNTGKSILVVESALRDDTRGMTNEHIEILNRYGTYPSAVMAKAGLEASHRTYDKIAEELYLGDISEELRAIRPTFLTSSRLRSYGGTTNCWNGWTRPMSAIDFRRSDIGPRWPIDRPDSYYNEAMRYCSLNDGIKFDNYDDQKFWETKASVQFIDTEKAGGALTNAVFTVVDQAKWDFQTVWGPDLERADAKACTVLRNANIRLVHATADGKAVDHLSGSTIENDAHGRDFTVKATHYVLATGGIEVARLLLWSAQQGGFNSHNDNLGRYFQVHPVNFSYAVFEPGPKLPSEELMDFYNNGVPLPFGAPPSRIFATLVPTDETLRARKLRNFHARINFGGFFPIIWEQEPNEKSSVRLSTKKDRFWDDALTDVDWHTLPVDDHTAQIAFFLVRDTMQNLGYGQNFQHHRPTISDPSDHHMGTARMGDSATNGYVDANCQVFGARNLYIASSAVFTTGGYANPTLTIVALAARLADHLASKHA